MLRAIDHAIATGVYPDMREHGREVDAWPEIYPRVLDSDILVLAGPIWLGDNSSVTKQVEYRSILAAAGLRVTIAERHTAALEQMVRQVAARLELLRMTNPGRLDELGIDVTPAGPVLEAAQAAIRDGLLDYVLLVGEKS